MGYPVETVAADMVLFVITIRDRVGVGIGRQGLVKGRIEDGHLRDTGHELRTDIDSHQIGHVMERRQFFGGFEYFPDGGINDNGRAKMLAAVNHPMANAADFAHIRQDAALAMDKMGQQSVHRFTMAGERRFGKKWFPSLHFVPKQGVG